MKYTLLKCPRAYVSVCLGLMSSSTVQHFNFEAQFLTKHSSKIAKMAQQASSWSSYLCTSSTGTTSMYHHSWHFYMQYITWKRLVGSPLHMQPKMMTTSPNSSVANSSAADRWAVSPSLSHYWLLVAPAMGRSTTDSYSCFVISCLCCHCHSQMTAFPRLSPYLLALTFLLHDPGVLGIWLSLHKCSV